MMKAMARKATIVAAALGLGAMALPAQEMPFGVGVSTDGGRTWSTRTRADGLGSHSVYDVFATDKALYAATEGGLSVSADKGKTWKNLSSKDGLAADNVLAFRMSDAAMCAGTSGGLSLSLDKGKTWKTLYAGSPAWSVAVDGRAIYALVRGDEAKGLPTRLAYTKDLGKTWKERDLDGDWWDYRCVVASAGKAYACAYDKDLLCYDSASDAWSWIKLPAGKSGRAMCSSGKTVYLATDGGFFSSEDGGATWKKLAGSTITDRVASDGSTIFASTDNIGIYAVFVSRDAGKTWDAIGTDSKVTEYPSAIYVLGDLVIIGEFVTYGGA